MTAKADGRTLVARVRRTIRERALLPTGSLVLVALSGGPDSAAMLAALATLARPLGLRLHAVTVDHGLRPEAAHDAELAGRQAQQLDVPFTRLALRLDAGAGVQARARQARYEALQEEASRLRADAITVGHTREDQAETVLMRVLRGSGLRGMSSIAPIRGDGVVRPLIDCERAAVHAHAAFTFGDMIARDYSNDDTRYERVRVRQTLIPALKAEDPQAVLHLAELADEARAVAQLLDGLAAQALQAATQNGDTLAVPILRAQPEAVRPAIFRAWLLEVTGITPTRSHLAQLSACLRGSGEVWLQDGWLVRCEGATLRVQREPTSGRNQGGANGREGFPLNPRKMPT